ncbi:uncharacterized protein LOC105795747 [Gossypium raimondii]|uniref:uncharacterized protein LOC105795747 n=1 Tax=Gossypium raimondii TaxID=29730 RepID=UPI00063AB2BB|nr:uncharacterized protein LOC105795747 [Gossypium raimondii]
MPPIPASKNWMKPPNGYVKINFDAAVLHRRMGFGFIARDSDGFVIGGSSGFKDKLMKADWAEMEAFDESLKMASNLNISKVIFESDCANLVNKVKKRGLDITIMGCCVNEACKIFDNFDLVKINWTNRSSNRVEDFMCKFTKTDYPSEIHDIVMNEAIN